MEEEEKLEEEKKRTAKKAGLSKSVKDPASAKQTPMRPRDDKATEKKADRVDRATKSEAKPKKPLGKASIGAKTVLKPTGHETLRNAVFADVGRRNPEKEALDAAEAKAKAEADSLADAQARERAAARERENARKAAHREEVAARTAAQEAEESPQSEPEIHD